MKLAEKSNLESASPMAGERLHQGERLLAALLDVTLPAGDLIALNVAFLAAYFLRYVLQVGGQVPGEFDVSYQDYIPVETAMTAIMLVTYLLKGTYRLPKGSSWLAEVSSILSATSIGVMVLFAAVSMFRYPASSRGLFIYLWLLAVVMVGSFRLLHRLQTIALGRRGVGIERLLVVGGGNALGRRIMHSIATERGQVAQVVGFVDLDPCDDFGRFRYLGTVKEVPAIVDEQMVDIIVIALPAASHDQVLGIMDHCQRRGVKIRVVPDLYQMRLHRADADTINGIPLIVVSESQIRGWNLLVKRVMDVTLAALTLAVLSPVLGLIALAIKLDSEGPVFFRQTRIGKDGLPFTLYKYRSMIQDAEKDLPLLWDRNEATGPIFKIRDDPRMTRVGKWLRRTSLDELPQLINVVNGEMSLVGPRPPLSAEVEKYEDWHLKRLDVSPGITGLWQVSGRSEIPFDEMVMLDIYYIENWSLGLDFTILLRTIPAVLTGGGAF
ncbi:MAG: sugar transferase [Bacteroidetes bacterium]|nr:sugar transferase [Bacteroidota bacterium]